MVAHELMFDPSDPVLARVRSLALAFPGAEEKISHGRPTFFTTKVFCYYGGSIKFDGSYVQHRQSVLVHPDGDDALSLLEEARCYRPAYLGPSGWVGVDLDTATDWTEIAELLDASFRHTARSALVAELPGPTEPNLTKVDNV